MSMSMLGFDDDVASKCREGDCPSKSSLAKSLMAKTVSRKAASAEKCRDCE